MTSGAWPIHPTSTPILPPLLSKVTESFRQFYLSRHTGRRLTWQLWLGSAELNVRFTSRTHDLNVSTFAMIILLLFEDLDDNEILKYEVRLLS